MVESANKTDWANIANGFVVYDPGDRNIKFFIPEIKPSNTNWGIDTTSNKYGYRAVTIDPESGERDTWRSVVPKASGAMVELDDGKQALILNDAYDAVSWVNGYGYAEGPYTNGIHGGFVTSASNAPSAAGFDITDIIPSGNTVPDTYQYVGSPIALVDETNSGIVFTPVGVINSVSAVTIGGLNSMRIRLSKNLRDSAQTRTAIAGERYIIGPNILRRRYPVAYLGDTPKQQSNLDYIYFYFKPTASTDTPKGGSIYLKLYFDYSSTPYSEWKAMSEDGVTMVADQERIKIDLTNSDGFVKVPVGGQSHRVFEMELEILEPLTKLDLYRIEVEGTVQDEERS